MRCWLIHLVAAGKAVGCSCLFGYLVVLLSMYFCSLLFMLWELIAVNLGRQTIITWFLHHFYSVSDAVCFRDLYHHRWALDDYRPASRAASFLFAYGALCGMFFILVWPLRLFYHIELHWTINHISRFTPPLESLTTRFAVRTFRSPDFQCSGLSGFWTFRGPDFQGYWRCSKPVRLDVDAGC